MQRTLSDNLKRIDDRIRAACARAGRERGDVTLIAVTKYVAPDLLRPLVELGVLDLGENRVQELARRAAMLREQLSRRAATGDAPAPRWHMVGHVQRNKVKPLLPWVDMIHSVDSLRLADEINAQAAKIERVVPVLVEVHASEEPTKSGMAVPAVTHFAAEISGMKNLKVCGLMAMGPKSGDEQRIRHVFGRVRELFDEVQGERLCGPDFRFLSMGMSQDFEQAIEFGATHVRIGSALFEGLPQAPAVDDEVD